MSIAKNLLVSLLLLASLYIAGRGYYAIKKAGKNIDRRTAPIFAVLLVIIVASASVLVKSATKEKYTNATTFGTINTAGDDVDGFNRTSEVLQRHYRRPLRSTLTNFHPTRAPFPVKTHAQRGRSAMDYMRLNSMDKGLQLNFANEIRIAGLNQ